MRTDVAIVGATRNTIANHQLLIPTDDTTNG